MSFLGVQGKTFLVLGVANRKSVAWAVAKILEEEGAEVIYSVRSEERRRETAKLLGERAVFVFDVESEEEIAGLASRLKAEGHAPLDGVLHSIAFADYSEGIKPFHETKRKDFLRATQVSTFSLVEVANACKPLLASDASVVTIGISSTHVTAEDYG